MKEIIMLSLLLSPCLYSQTMGQVSNTKNISSANKQNINQKDILPNNKRLTPSLSIQELRAGKADTANVVFINEGLKSGIFKYNRENVNTEDDSSMIIRVGNRRYEREYMTIMPEYFGANPNDNLDDGPAIQKALNTATKKGIKIIFSEGTYISSIVLIPKIVVPAPVYAYRLTLEGSGSGLTKIKSIQNQDIIRMTTGQPSFEGRESDIIIKDIHLDANNIASHCIKANHIAGFKLIDCKLTGATQSNLRIGELQSENYGIDIIRCYSGGRTVNEGHNNAGVELINSRYVYIDRLTTDGSKYGIFMNGSDKGFITNCHIEGSKVASIYIQGDGGGEHKISNNMFMPYVQYEPSAKFDGSIQGIHIEGNAGGGSGNLIYGNILLVPSPQILPFKSVLIQPSKALRAHPTYQITGSTSGATGFLFGFNPEQKKALIQVVNGKFKSGETITQSVTKGTAVLGEIIPGSSTGISIGGTAEFNVINANQIRMNPSVGISLTSNNNIVSNNNIEAETAIWKNTPFAILTGNILNSKNGNAISNRNGTVEMSANQIIGQVIGLSNK